jgi:hypothetical protein
MEPVDVVCCLGAQLRQERFQVDPASEEVFALGKETAVGDQTILEHCRLHFMESDPSGYAMDGDVQLVIQCFIDCSVTDEYLLNDATVDHGGNHSMGGLVYGGLLSL